MLVIPGVTGHQARSLEPALMVGGKALSQLWLFIVAPLSGSALAGLLVCLGVVHTD